MRRTQRAVSRREVVRAIPIFGILSAIGGGLGFLSSACEVDHPDYLTARRHKQPTPELPPTDDDEYVASEVQLSPVDVGDKPPELPNGSWEARARQLEGEQSRLYGAVFTADAATNRMMAGKERSHVPHVERAPDAGSAKRVTVVIDHVMGGSGSVAEAGVDATAAADGGDAAIEAGMAASAAATATAPVHYVTTVYLRAMLDGKDSIVGLWELSSTDPAPVAVTFTLPPDVTSVVAYEQCTLHGLWKSDPLPL